MSADPLGVIEFVRVTSEELLRRAHENPDISPTDRTAIAHYVREANAATRKAQEMLAHADRIARPPEAVDATRSKRSKPAVELAEKLFRELLPRDGRGHPSAPIVSAMKASGLSTASIHRARVRLAIAPSRTKTFHAGTTWSWPLLVSGSEE